MNLEHLSVYISVVENGGFTRAAQALGISHSTTSRAVAALEEALDVRLLDRNSRGFKLTEAGSLLYEEGVRLIKEVRELERRTRDAGSGVARSLRVAVAPMGDSALKKVLELLEERFPDATPVIYRRGLSEVKELVASGQAELGAGFSYALGDMTGFETKTAADSGFVAIAAQGHLLGEAQPLGPGELRAYHYITAGGRRAAFTAALEEPILRDRDPEEIHAVASLEELFDRVRRGEGISLVPAPMAEEYGQGCRVMELDFDTKFQITLFWSEKAGRQSSLFTDGDRA